VDKAKRIHQRKCIFAGLLMKPSHIIRIVLVSPGDVAEERKVMEAVIDEVNRCVAADRNLHLELSRWETDAYPGFHAEGPKGIIDPILRIEAGGYLVSRLD